MNESTREGITSHGIRTTKSCKGYLYYTSTLESKSINPRCVGFPRTLPPAKKYTVGGPMHEAMLKTMEQGPSHFYYSCLGYSTYIDANVCMDANANSSSTTDKHRAKLEIPICTGHVLIMELAPEHVHNKEDGRELPKGQPQPPQSQSQPQPPQSQPYRPAPSHSPGDDFYSRFTRSASLVASGVARNVLRVGTYVKVNVGDILSRRPK